MANINTELEQIRKAVYGREVRGSIANAIELINKEQISTSTAQSNLDSKFNELIINAGNSNAEVVVARIKADGTKFDTLGKRLNKGDEVHNALNNEVVNARIDSKNVTHKNLKTRLDEFDSQLGSIENNKADKIEMNKKASIEELNSVKLNKASLIELEVERKRIDSLISQGNGVDNAETADIRVSASGLKYTSAGNSVRETQKGNAILDDAITPRHLSTMKTLNVFNGQYIQGKYIGGSAVGNMTLSSNSNYFLIAIDVEPSTTYSIFYGNDVGVEDGHYWFKIASSTKTKNEVLSLSDKGSYSFDGSIAFSNTSSSYQAGQKITTSATDKSLFILVSKYTKPNYFEVIK